MGDSRKFVYVVLIAATMAIGIVSINNFQSADAGGIIFTVNKTCSPLEQFAPGTIRWDIDVTNASQDPVDVPYTCTGTFSGDSISGIVSQDETDSTFFEVTGLPAGEYPNTIICNFTDLQGNTFESQDTSESCFVNDPIETGYFVGAGVVLLEEGEKQKDNVYLTHGFQLHCQTDSGPNNLEVNWEGNQFQLVELERADCFDDGSQNEPPPSKDTKEHGPGPFLDVYQGSGFGRVNGECGGFAEWVFDDNGNPGKADHIVALEITDADGGIVLSINPAGLAQTDTSSAGTHKNPGDHTDAWLDLVVGNHQWVPHPTDKHGPTQTSPCEEVTPSP